MSKWEHGLHKEKNTSWHIFTLMQPVTTKFEMTIYKIKVIVINLDLIPKGFISRICMPNMKSISRMVQKFLQKLQFLCCRQSQTHRETDRPQSRCPQISSKGIIKINLTLDVTFLNTEDQNHLQNNVHAQLQIALHCHNIINFLGRKVTHVQKNGLGR